MLRVRVHVGATCGLETSYIKTLYNIRVSLMNEQQFSALKTILVVVGTYHYALSKPVKMSQTICIRIESMYHIRFESMSINVLLLFTAQVHFCKNYSLGTKQSTFCCKETHLQGRGNINNH